MKSLVCLLILMNLFFSQKIWSEDLSHFSISDCQQPLQQVLDLGWSNIAGLKLRKVLREARQSGIQVQYGGGIHIVTDNRRHARYSNGRIHFNRSQDTGLNYSQMQSLCTHELLGALGYEDKDFSLSSKLKFIVQNNLPSTGGSSMVDFLDYSKSRIETQDWSMTKQGGSGGIVHGGGDYFFLETKTNAFQYLYEQHLTGRYDNSYFRRIGHGIQNCKLEFFTDEDNEYPFLATTRGGWDESEEDRYSVTMQSIFGEPNIVKFKKYPSTLWIDLDYWQNLSLPQQNQQYIDWVLTLIVDKGINCDLQNRPKREYTLLGDDAILWEHPCYNQYPKLTEAQLQLRNQCVISRRKRLSR